MNPPLLDRTFPARTETLAEVRTVVREASRQAGCGEECGEALVLAVNEACMNIIQHGYCRAENQSFRLLVIADDGMLHMRLLDNGRPATLADLRPREFDDLRPGGLGVRFMREVTDNVEYLPPPDGYANLLQLSKRIC